MASKKAAAEKEVPEAIEAEGLVQFTSGAGHAVFVAIDHVAAVEGTDDRNARLILIGGGSINVAGSAEDATSAIWGE